LRFAPILIIWGRPEQIVPAKESGSRRAGEQGIRGQGEKRRKRGFFLIKGIKSRYNVREYERM